jgi:hypothetical protein
VTQCSLAEVTDNTNEHTASIFRVYFLLADCFLLVACWNFFSILKMDVAGSSEDGEARSLISKLLDSVHKAVTDAIKTLIEADFQSCY